jgi:hypothetical protein
VHAGKGVVLLAQVRDQLRRAEQAGERARLVDRQRDRRGTRVRIVLPGDDQLELAGR